MAKSQHISAQSRQALGATAGRLKAAAVVGPATVKHLNTILAAGRSLGGAGGRSGGRQVREFPWLEFPASLVPLASSTLVSCLAQA